MIDYNNTRLCIGDNVHDSIHVKHGVYVKLYLRSLHAQRRRLSGT